MRPDELKGIFSKMEVVDLTQSFYKENPTPYSWDLLWDYRDEGGPFNGSISFIEHSGTHIDAPLHFLKDVPALDELPLETFYAPISIIDVREKTSIEADYQVSTEDIINWEEDHGKLQKGTFVAFWTGWDRLWRDKKAFLGLDDEGHYHHPGLSVDAALMLSEKRGVKGVGIDCYGVDTGASVSSNRFSTHHVLLSRGKYIIEVLNNLSRLPPKGAFCFAVPLKFHKGTGSPARAIAFTKRDP